MNTLARFLSHFFYDAIRNNTIINQGYIDDKTITVMQRYALLNFPAQEPISMSDLSAKMRLANSTVTRLIEGLLKDDLVAREQGIADRRVVQVRLTERGSHMRREVEEEFDTFFAPAWEGVPIEERELVVRHMNTIIEYINQAVQQKHGKPD